MPKTKSGVRPVGQSFTVYLQPIDGTDDLHIQLPQEFLDAEDWREGDVLDFQPIEAGGLSLVNKSKAKREAQRVSHESTDSATGSATQVSTTSVADLKVLLALAERVLGSKEVAESWLHAPARGLGRAIPIEHAQTASGKAEVMELLLKIEAGVYI